MDLIKLSIEKPVAVTVCVMLTILFGILALTSIPIQLTPNVDEPVVTVTTNWVGASPQEVEQEIVEKQEEQLKSAAGLRRMTSQSVYGSGTVRLQFEISVGREEALREVSDLLRQVPEYPENVDEPIIEAGDPNNKDYIAWIILECSDPQFDTRTLQDFTEDEVKPILKRVPGVSAIGVLGGNAREVQVRVDPVRMAQLGVTFGAVADALRAENINVSAGRIEEGKTDVTVRTVGKYESAEEIQQTIIAYGAGGPIRIGDFADTVVTYREPESFVRSRGKTVLAINVQRESGSNVIEVMKGVRAAVASLNEPGSILDQHAKRLGLGGPLTLEQVYDQTIYIDQAIGLVNDNIYLGGAITMLSLVLFLRSIPALGIIALTIPVCLIGTFVAMAAMGRNLNVISLAGLAFATGVVVDNANVVIDNIMRHQDEKISPPERAVYNATREVWLAVLASTLTTVVVFFPVLIIKEEVGQLFRDIALALVVSVILSLVIAVTVVPCAAQRTMKPRRALQPTDAKPTRLRSITARAWALLDWSHVLGRFVEFASGSVLARLAVIIFFVGISVWGSKKLMPPADYLPKGNRNLVFGVMITPPGYNLEKMQELSDRVEPEIKPYWEAGLVKLHNPDAYPEAAAKLPTIPTFDFATMGPGPEIQPPGIENYFLVGFGNVMFHGGISSEDDRVVDMMELMNHATRQENLPGVFAFAQQAPLFQIGGAGSSIEVEVSGDNLDVVNSAALNLFMGLGSDPNFGFQRIQPNPGNFNVPAPEMRLSIDRIRASQFGITTRDLGLAASAAGDGAFAGEYHIGGQTVDIRVITKDAAATQAIDRAQRIAAESLADIPLASRTGQVVPLSSVATLTRTTAPEQINHAEERRAVTLNVTPPDGMPLEAGMNLIKDTVTGLRTSGQIPPAIDVQLAGSADKLTSVRTALLGDGTFLGLLQSRFFLAVLINYLVMAVLFESFVYPFVIMFSVPLAAVGGFAGLALVHQWSVADRYMPDQNLDVLTMLGFVILLGTVVNNAILLVAQALNFMKGYGESELDKREPLAPRKAIAESVRTRLRPIIATSLTTVTGTLPLVIMPGAGSELYRGLGSVVTGGLVVSTIFTLILVPLTFSLVLDIQFALARMHPHFKRYLPVPDVARG